MNYIIRDIEEAEYPLLENFLYEAIFLPEGIEAPPKSIISSPKLKENGERIGTCSFIPGENGEIYDIAYCVHKKHWRKGYATEMISGMIDYAKQQGAKKITVCVGKENAGSNAVVKKLGFTVAEENAYKKRGTDVMCADYIYELNL